MTVCETPLLAASFLKSSSQVSNVPVPQAAAKAGAAEIVSRALSVKALIEKPGFIGSGFSRIEPIRTLVLQTQQMFAARAAKTRLLCSVWPHKGLAVLHAQAFGIGDVELAKL